MTYASKTTGRNLSYFNIEERRYIPSSLQFKGTIVNRTCFSLLGGSLKNMSTVPLTSIGIIYVDYVD